MPFDTILVPVDGSELGDAILTQLRRLLVVRDARVTLLRVVPLVGDEAARPMQERLDAAQAHLGRLRAGLLARGVDARTLLLTGDPAAVILDVVKTERPSLVALSTHGRSGPSRWVRGSVAERVLRACEVPLLLANPRALADAPASPGELRVERILVPLDGSPLAASIAPTVLDLARLFQAEVMLLHVGGAMPILLDTPMLDPTLLPTPEELARAVEPVRAQLALAGLRARIEVAYGPPAAQIIAEAERHPATLLAMTTHGRTGALRWALGSVAESVLRACACPMLVQRVVPPPPPR